MIPTKYDPRDAGLFISSEDGHQWQVLMDNESLKALKSSGLELAVVGSGERRVVLQIRKPKIVLGRVVNGVS